MQNFLIKEEVDFEQMCEDFIKQTFGEDKYVSFDIWSYDEHIMTPNYTEFTHVEIVFNEYKWVNKFGDEKSETVGIHFKNNFLQPFYIDGKFKSMEVYEAISWHPIQKHTEIYGIEKEKLENMFYDFITNC